MSDLRDFFVVTTRSIYHVVSGGKGIASAIKVSRSAKPKSVPPEDLCQGRQMIAVGKWLQAYTPEKYGPKHKLSAFEPNIEKVSMHHRGAHSFSIVALFLTLEEALACAKIDKKQPRDARWIDSTKKVIELIGEGHPSFFVRVVPHHNLFTDLPPQ